MQHAAPHVHAQARRCLSTVTPCYRCFLGLGPCLHHWEGGGGLSFEQVLEGKGPWIAPGVAYCVPLDVQVETAVRRLGGAYDRPHVSGATVTNLQVLSSAANLLSSENAHTKGICNTYNVSLCSGVEMCPPPPSAGRL